MHTLTPAQRITLLCLSLTASTLQAAIQCDCPPASFGSSLFNLSFCVEGEVANISGNSINDIMTQIDESPLSSRFPNYGSGTSVVVYQLDMRGLLATLGYNYGSTELIFYVPSLDMTKTFDGGTRDASNQLFRDYLNESKAGIMREIMRNSPVDPVAGNPASLQSQMLASDFDAGTSPAYDSLPPGRSLNLGANISTYSLGKYTQTLFTLPISYSYTFANYDRLIVQAPISYTEVDGVTTYRGNFGLAYRKNIYSRWSITPAIGYGVTGSSGLGSSGQLLSASLTSDLMLYHDSRFRLSMGNMIGYYSTMSLNLGDGSSDYDLKNTVTRNGLLLSIPMQKRFWNREFSIDIFAIDTSFAGDPLYSDSYQEYGITFGPARSADKMEPNQSSHPFGFGLKYVTGDGDIEGVELTFGYRF